MSNEIAIYLRKSRDEENESRDVTLARHEKLLLEYCERNDLIVKKIYKEVVSGESIDRLSGQRYRSGGLYAFWRDGTEV